MSRAAVITNGVPRVTVDAYDVSSKERARLDYLDWDAIDRGEDSATFFRYRGWLYDLGNFARLYGDDTFPGWDGYMSETYFSGLLVRIVDGGESVVVGRFFAD